MRSGVRNGHVQTVETLQKDFHDLRSNLLDVGVLNHR